MEMEIKCKACKRFLGKVKQSTEVSIKCSNSKCKELNEYKIVFYSDMVKQHAHQPLYNK